MAALRTIDPEAAIGSARLRRAAAVLLACTGAGMAICGLFTLRVMPVHMLGFLLALGFPVVSFVVGGRYLRLAPGWRTFGTRLAVIGSPVALVLLIAFFATFQPTADGAEHGIAGLVQRIGAVHALAWFAALGLRAYRDR